MAAPPVPNTGPPGPSPSSSSSSSPYYSMTSFALMGPLAVFYSCAANGLLRLAAAAGIRSQQTQMQQIQQMPAVPGPVAVPASVTPLLKREGPRRLRVAIVTGCNTGIGFETARSLVLDHNVHVIMACRSRDKAVQAIEKIAAVRDEPARSKAQAQASAQAENNATGSEDIAKAVFVHPLDLSSFDSVKAFCAAVRKEYPAVDILVNNAGRNTNGESVSLSAAAASAAAAAAFDNSVDQQQPQIPLDLLFQSNFLGHFLLTSELLNADVLVPNARVVNLSSVMHHFCGTTSNGSGSAAATNGWESVDYWKQTATANCAPTDTYSPSKLAAQLFTLELNRRYGGSGSTGSESRRLRSIAVNPGAVNSDIWRDFPSILKFFFNLIYLNNRQGCQTSVAAAVGEWDDDVVYLQPYWLPATSRTQVPFPVVEMLGVYQGHRVTQPRLPADGGLLAGQALWKASEELTGAEWK